MRYDLGKAIQFYPNRFGCQQKKSFFFDTLFKLPQRSLHARKVIPSNGLTMMPRTERPQGEFFFTNPEK